MTFRPPVSSFTFSLVSWKTSIKGRNDLDLIFPLYISKNLSRTTCLLLHLRLIQLYFSCWSFDSLQLQSSEQGVCEKASLQSEKIYGISCSFRKEVSANGVRAFDIQSGSNPPPQKVSLKFFVAKVGAELRGYWLRLCARAPGISIWDRVEIWFVVQEISVRGVIDNDP